jgi:hypothetical protein
VTPSVISRRIVYPVVAGLLFSLWLFYTILVWFGGYMMSVDEEWEGWGDVLLNPYIMGIWTLLGGAFAAFALLYLRWWRRH